jgi:hypothetical protein
MVRVSHAEKRKSIAAILFFGLVLSRIPAGATAALFHHFPLAKTFA